jgi:hypothetical protein
VATAFLGPKPSKSHVVDHIDTNRKNNRPENLRWVTRLENILLNPITARRIEIAYGSIEEFFANPNKPKSSKLDQNFEWMRSVTKEEAEQARKSLQHWAESQGQPSGGSLGEWIFRPRHRELDAFYEQKAEKQSESVSKLNEIKEKVTKTNLDRPPVRMAVVFRGMARHVDYCPLEMRIWKGKPYANFIDDCLYSPCCASSEDGYVYCIGGRSITSQDEYEAWKKKVEMKA